LFEDAILPTVREMGLGIHVLGEKAVLMRNAEEIQDCGNEIEMGDQNRLGKVAPELLVSASGPVPKLRDGFPKSFRVQLVKVSPNLKSFIYLEGSELADRNAPNQLGKGVWAEACVDL
jgi:hypothetical protein